MRRPGACQRRPPEESPRSAGRPAPWGSTSALAAPDRERAPTRQLPLCRESPNKRSASTLVRSRLKSAVTLPNVCASPPARARLKKSAVSLPRAPERSPGTLMRSRRLADDTALGCVALPPALGCLHQVLPPALRCLARTQVSKKAAALPQPGGTPARWLARATAVEGWSGAPDA